MIKLAFAIGFLAVFGLVAYCLVLLLSNHFKKENNKINNQQKPENQNNHEQNIN